MNFTHHKHCHFLLRFFGQTLRIQMPQSLEVSMSNDALIFFCHLSVFISVILVRTLNHEDLIFFVFLRADDEVNTPVMFRLLSQVVPSDCPHRRLHRKSLLHLLLICSPTGTLQMTVLGRVSRMRSLSHRTGRHIPIWDNGTS